MRSAARTFAPVGRGLPSSLTHSPKKVRPGDLDESSTTERHTKHKGRPFLGEHYHQPRNERPWRSGIDLRYYRLLKLPCPLWLNHYTRGRGWRGIIRRKQRVTGIQDEATGEENHCHPHDGRILLAFHRGHHANTLANTETPAKLLRGGGLPNIYSTTIFMMCCS